MLKALEAINQFVEKAEYGLSLVIIALASSTTTLRWSRVMDSIILSPGLKNFQRFEKFVIPEENMIVEAVHEVMG